MSVQIYRKKGKNYRDLIFLKVLLKLTRDRKYAGFNKLFNVNNSEHNDIEHELG